jgi:hypothetical protein
MTNTRPCLLPSGVETACSAYGVERVRSDAGGGALVSGELRVRETITPVVDRALAVVKKQSRGQARTAEVVISQVNTVGGTARFGGVQPYP